MRDNAEEKIARVGAWCSGFQRCFLQRIDQAKATPMAGSPAENSVARKVSQKRSLKNFSSNRGDLMAAEDSKDEGGVVGVRYDH